MSIFKFTSNLKCNGCIQAITPLMNSLKGIKSWKVDLTVKPVLLEVETDTETAEEIIQTVKNAGYTIELL